jgi:hypothetical protein
MMKAGILMIFLFLLISCSKDAAKDVLNVVDEIEVTLSQNVNEKGPFVEFLISTVVKQ